MGCSVYDRLEDKLLRHRERRLQHSMAESLPDEAALLDAEEEQRLIDELTDHRAEHGCASAGE
jgi:hypothetical protein